MPDHVSPETGKRLKEAGLQWVPAVGDWCHIAGARRDAQLVVDVGCDGRLGISGWGMFPADKGLWLPTTGQLLEALVARGLRPQLAWLDKWVVLFHISAGWLTVEHEHPAEALAEVWLRLQRGVQV